MQRRTISSLAALLTAVLAFGLSAPAQATPPYGPDAEYVALGDSFSSGLGATGSSPGGCGTSPNGYPALWAEQHGITSFIDASCGGAKTEDVLSTQLSALSATTDVVTITIGGNDAVLGNLVTNCLLGNAQCNTVNQQFVVDLPGYLAKVEATYAAIRDAAPNADVYVLGYPHIFETGWFCYGLFVPNQYQRQKIVASIDLFDNGLGELATDAGFHWVDVRSIFSGHNVCSLQPWVRSVVDLPPVHPNDNGYRYGYLAALTAVTG